MITFAVGRGIEYYDAPSVDDILTEAGDGGLGTLVKAVIHSVPFQMCRAEHPEDN